MAVTLLVVFAKFAAVFMIVSALSYLLLLSRVECLEMNASVVSVCISPFPATAVCDTLSFLTSSKLFCTIT